LYDIKTQKIKTFHEKVEKIFEISWNSLNFYFILFFYKEKTMQNIIKLADISNFENLMSSREIADLTGKNHQHIMRDIRRMLEDLGDESHCPNLDSENCEGEGWKKTTYLNTRNQKQPEILLNFELTMTLISGYNVVLRNRIIKRWQELELQQQQIQLAKQSKQLLALENKLQDAQIKACQFDALVAQSGVLNFRKVAKELELNERSLKSWLIQNDWISLRGSQKKMSPKSWTIRKKYMVFKHQLTESGDISTYPMALFSYKGIKEIQRRLMTLGLHAQRGLF
jgi:anti-repressor protein